MLLHLVRHGQPVIEPGRPPSTWRLDESAETGLTRLRDFLAENARTAAWYSSDEPKAVGTARALTDGSFGIEPALREAVRSDWFPRRDQLEAAVLAAFDAPGRAARAGWEPFEVTRRRIADAVEQIVAGSTTDVVLVGHGTAWTLLVSEVTGRPPDTAAWSRLRTPDLCVLDLERRSIARPWGDW